MPSVAPKISDSRATLVSRAWMIVALLWVVALLNYLDRLMITTMRLSLRDAIAMTDAQFGLLTSVFLWVYGALSPLGGFFADRLGRSRVIVASLFVWSLATLLTAFSRNLDQLLLSRIVMGISEACYIPAALALIADYHRGPTRSLATGVHMTGISAGSALGGVGGWLAAKYGWHQPFLLFGGIGITYALVLWALLRDAPVNHGGADSQTPHPRIDLGRALVSLLGDGRFLLLVIYWTLYGMAGWTLAGWLPTYLNERFQLSQAAAGLSATGYLQTASFLGVLVGGFWADRWSRRNPRARMLVPMIGLLAAAPALLLAGRTDLLVLAIAGVSVCGFSRAFVDSNMMPILCLVADARYRATGYGVLNMFSTIAGGGMIYLGGYLKDRQVPLGTMLLAAAGCYLLCGLSISLVKPRHRDAASAPSSGHACDTAMTGAERAKEPALKHSN